MSVLLCVDSMVHVYIYGCYQLPECQEVERRKGLVIPCMIYYLENTTSARCRELLGRLETLVFTDYQLVYKFVEHCEADIQKLQCGRVGSDNDKPQVQT